MIFHIVIQHSELGFAIKMGDNVAKSRFLRQFILYSMLLCGGMLANIGISAEAIGCLSDPANKYAGMYFMYPHQLHQMWIIVETDTGVDDDHEHRVLDLSGSSCADPDLEYHHYDYNYWDDGSGIPGKKDRRLWVIKATGLTPDCFYDATFKYRDYEGAYCWHSTHGHFWSSPPTSSTNPDSIPHDLDFYGFGDTRIIDDDYPLDWISKKIMAHDGKHTFILHTGDFVYQGGRPVGWYYFRNGHKSNGDPNPWLLHDNDWWYKNFFQVGGVYEMLRHMPILPVFGNHEDMDSAVNGKYSPQSNTGKYYHTDETNRMYNYTHYFRAYNQGDGPEDQYYNFAYGPALFWSLTSFPMDTDAYCSDTNRNYRPKDEGGTGQYDWLKDHLEASANDPRQWKIVMLHAPIYSPCDCNNQEDARKYLTPLFEEYGVDLVLAGHEHYYARKTVNDISYLILGGGGAGIDLCSACTSNQQCNGFDMVYGEHHFAYFKISGDTLSVEVLGYKAEDQNYGVIDSLKIDKSPDADFEADPMKGVPPFTVNFTDKSTGNVYQYDWDFGDESDHSQERDPSHTYADAGKYTVTLKVSSAFNTSAPYSAIVNIAPVADFVADPTEGPLGISVQFVDKSKGGVSAWLWDFGDGATSTEKNPVHQYNKNGKFTVKLTVTGEGVSDTKTREDYLRVEPWADFTEHPDGCAQTIRCPACCEVQFANKSRGDGLTYQWDFDDGSTSSNQDPAYNFCVNENDERQYRQVQLIVTDTKGHTDSETHDIHVCAPWARPRPMHR